ncbi:PREDICTED: NACHT, LRR and PYD domains-containing protein 12-like [Gekko japonicus]|uniref:NACHT, LRR and PYD domains-containing protein 12-like n=1 Tax=Gekko japonicus TaxID=146911 RepID=A0ABM1K6R6_GEKJA|nr:PREDICTED: NACHT, LRR and PYD domains-containing protein 12-like [Gekko japonicus]
MALGGTHAQLMRKRASSAITIETLFKPDKHGLKPQIIVLQGVAGIGKTMTARKIMLDWACGELYEDMFDYVFYIHCREVNLFTEESSIAEMILKQWASKNTIKAILKNPKKLLFIVDGFDELRFSLDQPKDCLCTDPWQKKPVGILLSSLFQKHVLPKSCLIITTRPTALQKLHHCLECSRYAEILGFSERDKREYFHKFFQDKHEAEKAFGLVRQNETLLTMCFVPIVCWVVCTVMKQQMERSEDFAQTANTLTAVYMLYLYSLFKSDKRYSKQLHGNKLKSLCSLAIDGIWKQEILFGEDEIKDRGLDQYDSLPLFMSENIFKRDIDCECVYSFVHLSFQEFFAALSFVFEEEQAQDSEKLNLEITSACCGNLASTLSTNQSLTELVLKRNTIGDTGIRLLSAGLRHPKCKLKKVRLTSCKITSSGCGDLSSVLSTSQTLKDLGLGNNELEDSGVRLLCEGLRAPHCKIQALKLDSCGITSSGCGDLSSVLSTSQTLKELHLRENELEDSGVRLLFDSLKNPHCKIQKINLSRCCLTAGSCEGLSSVLTTSQALTELDVSRNMLGDSGVIILCEGLKHPSCKLLNLRLQFCKLTAACCGELSCMFPASQTLIDLDLSGNYLGDSGIISLCGGLKHLDCRLQKLKLSRCSFTQACCSDLAQVLSKNQHLKELDLSNNELRDNGVKLLCDGIKHPDCKVETLLGDQEEEEVLSWLDEHSQGDRPQPGKKKKRAADPWDSIFCRLCPHGENLSEKIKPEVVWDPERNHQAYRLHLPGAGFFHCCDTNIRFEVRAAVTIQYQQDSWYKHWNERKTWKLIVAGPLLNIQATPAQALSAVHFPHLLCLAGKQEDSPRVQIAHFAEGRVTLEKPDGVEPFHIVLKHLRLSPCGVVFKNTFFKRKTKVHAAALLYQVHGVSPLKFHLYLLPNDCSLIKAIHVRELTCLSRRVQVPTQTTKPLTIGSCFLVRRSEEVKASPKELKFNYVDAEAEQQYFEVCAQCREAELELTLVEKMKNEIFWKVCVRPEELTYAMQDQ